MKLFESLGKLGKYKVEKGTMSLKELEKELKKYKERSIKEDSYLILATPWAIEKLTSIKDNRSRRDLFNLFKNWDDKGYINLSEGKYLESLLSTMNLGAHHIGYPLDLDDVENNEIVRSIATTGLRNMGDLMSSGALFHDDVEPSKTISAINNPLHLVMHLKGTYKYSNTKFILGFPKDLVDEDMHFLSSDKAHEVYNYIDGIPHVDPKYIISFYTTNDNVCTSYDIEMLKNKGFSN